MHTNNLNKLFLCCSIVWLGSFSQGLANNQPIAPPTTLLELQHSPSPYECAVLSAHVYKKATKEGEGILVEDRKTKHTLPDWTVLRIFQTDELSQAWQQLGLPYDSQAILYHNATKKQLVLSYPGLELSSITPIKAKDSAKHLIASQEKVLTDHLTEALSIAQKQHCSLAVTGHSLGGWLAQLTTFMAQQLYPETHVKAIAFDSPGARPMLEHLNAGPDAIQLDYLDITNYVSTPNFINASSPHVGTVFQVVFERFSHKPVAYNQQSHDVHNFFHVFSPNTGVAYQCAFVQQWPLLPPGSIEKQGSERVKPSQVISHLLTKLQQCTLDESLRSYKSFFKLAEKASRYHSSPFKATQQASAEATHTYTYKIRPFRQNYAHIRHVPRIARQFLIGVQRKAPANVNVATQYPSVYALQWNRKRDFVSIPLQQDVHLVVDQLTSLTTKYPTSCAPTTLLNHLVLATNSLLPPPAVSFFVGRKSLQKELLRAFVSEKPRVIAPPITGPGGIGKSQLAIRVMAQQAMLHHYEHIFWISAETPEKLRDSYLSIAESLGIYVDKRNLKNVVQDVRAHLQNKHCLYVFDDASSSKAIEGFLPLHRGHVIITSRNSNGKFWYSDPLVVKPLDTSEALALAQSYGYGKTESEETLLKTLLTQLPRYPLSLVQLLHTLNDEGIHPEAFLKELNNYKEATKAQKIIAYLSQDPHPRTKYDRVVSMLYIFEKSFEKLFKEEHGPKAIHLLSQLAYYDSQGIPLDFVLTLDKEDKSKLKRKIRAALLLLEKYSFVQWDRNQESVYVHTETQLIVRHLYPWHNKRELVDSLINYIGSIKHAYTNADKWIALIPHGRALFEKLCYEKPTETTYVLAKFLLEACSMNCLLEESLHWGKVRLSVVQNLHPAQAHPDVAASLSYVGHSLVELGRYQEALIYRKKALFMEQKIHQDQAHPQVAKYMNRVGMALMSLGKYRESAVYFRDALGIGKRIYGNQAHPKIARCLNNLGYSLGQLSNHYEALEYQMQALKMRQQLYKGKDRLRLAISLNDVGYRLGELGDHQAALKYQQQALAMKQRIYQGKDHSRLAISLNDVGNRLGMLNRHEEALKHQKEALAMRERIYKEQDHPRLAISLNDVGYRLGRLHHYKEALAYQKKALAMSKRLFKEQDHPWAIYILYRMGSTLARAKAYQAAEKYFQRALKLQRQLYSHINHSEVALVLNGLGEVSEELKKMRDAINFYNQALCMALRVYQKKHPKIELYGHNLINALSQTEDLVFVRKIKSEVLPLCTQYLGKNHELTEALLTVGNTP